VFIDEIKPQKSASLSLGWVAESREDMPRSRQNKEDDCAGENAQLCQMAQISGEQQIQANRADRKHQTDQTFGERTFRAQATANPQQVQRVGGSSSSERRKK
jgi:hypothetical protein